jgi:hypothetical protein
MSTDMMYSKDLNFDGVRRSSTHAQQRVGPVRYLGAFPVEYTSDTATSNGIDKEDSKTKWLFGGQVGADWTINRSNRLKLAGAYYRSRTSKASVPALARRGRAAGLRHRRHARGLHAKGNTVFNLRNITTEPGSPRHPEPQFVGLASKFDVLDLNLVWDTELPDLKLRSQANFIHNLAYDKARCSSAGRPDRHNLNSQGEFESGGNAMMVSFTLGSALEMHKRGDWNVFAGYKYISPTPCRMASTTRRITWAAPTPRATSLAATTASTRTSTPVRVG